MIVQKRKISANLASHILAEAMKLSGLNQTQALTEGLIELIKKEKRAKLLASEGIFHFRYDVKTSRKRSG